MKQKKVNDYSRSLIGIDPGGTNGVCIFESGELTYTGQLDLWELGQFLSGDIDPLSTIICEAYRLRASSAKSMIGNSFPAPEAIGLIKYMAYDRCIPLVMQSPAQKEFFTNERLKALGVYQTGHRHANDAIRHVLYHRAFTLKEEKLLQMISLRR